jgi:hypothetical protein
MGFVRGHHRHYRLQYSLLFALHLGDVDDPARGNRVKGPGPRYLAVLLGLGFALWLPRLRGPLDLRYDAGVYYILGTSLAEGRGYRLLSEPGAIQAIQYPPLLPAVAAGYQLLLGTSSPAVAGHWLRVGMCVLFLAYIAAVFALARRFLSLGYAFLVGLLTVLHLQTLFLSDFFAADVPYALLTVLFFLVALSPAAGTEQGKSRTAREVASGALAIAAYALRTAGAALLGAWVMESLFHRRVRQAAIRAAIALLAVGSWQWYTVRVRAGADYSHPAYAYQRADYQFYNVGYLENMRYIDPFRPELGRISTADLAKRVVENLRLMPLSLGEAVSLHKGWWRGEVDKANQKWPALGLPTWLADAALMALSIPVVLGFLLLAIRGHWLIVLYVGASVLLIALTPWPVQFSRYMVPLTPFLVLGLIYLLADLSSRARRGTHSAARSRWSRSLAALGMIQYPLIALILIQQTYTLYKSYTKHYQRAQYTDAQGRSHQYRLFFYDRNWRLHDDGLEWLARVARPGEIVATSTPHWAYLKTGLPAIMPPYEVDVSEAERLVEAVPVTYLVVDNLSFLDVGRRYTLPVIQRAPDRWSLIYFANDSGPRIYRRTSAPPVSRLALPETSK